MLEDWNYKLAVSGKSLNIWIEIVYLLALKIANFSKVCLYDLYYQCHFSIDKYAKLQYLHPRDN